MSKNVPLHGFCKKVLRLKLYLQEQYFLVSVKKVHSDTTFNKKLKLSIFVRCHPDRREGTEEFVTK